MNNSKESKEVYFFRKVEGLDFPEILKYIITLK